MRQSRWTSLTRCCRTGATADRSWRGRAVDPADDFTSELLAVHHRDAEQLSYREVESIVYGLSFAGHEIVSHLLSNSLICLPDGRSPVG